MVVFSGWNDHAAFVAEIVEGTVRRDEFRTRWGGVGVRTMKGHRRKSTRMQVWEQDKKISVRSRVINRWSKEAGGVANSLELCAANVEAEKRPLNRDPTPGYVVIR